MTAAIPVLGRAGRTMPAGTVPLLVTAAALSLHSAQAPTLAIVFAAVCLAAAFIDARTGLLPLRITVGGTLAALTVVAAESGWTAALGRAAWVALVVSGCLGFVALYSHLWGREMAGGGDALLLGFFVAVLGPGALAFVFLPLVAISLAALAARRAPRGRRRTALLVLLLVVATAAGRGETALVGIIAVLLALVLSAAGSRAMQAPLRLGPALAGAALVAALQMASAGVQAPGFVPAVLASDGAYQSLLLPRHP